MMKKHDLTQDPAAFETRSNELQSSILSILALYGYLMDKVQN